jgi:alpha-1,3-rhamnosyl/mannosyltransferase
MIRSTCERGPLNVRVVLNQLPALGRKTGIGHYIAELLRGLHRQAGEDVIEASPQGGVGLAVRVGRRLAGECGGLHSLHSGLSCWLQRCGRALLGRYQRAVLASGRYDLYHEPNYIPVEGDLPTVTTICDLSVFHYPEWHPRKRVAYFEKNFHQGLGRAQHFLALSDFVRHEIIRTLHLDPEQFTRTYPGVRHGLRPLPGAEVAKVLQELGLPPRYLLYLGTIEPRKNVRMLLRAYCSLPRPLRERWPLLLVGGLGWNVAETADYLHNQARHRGVIWLDYVADKHLPAIYNGARALLFPSVYEGFGLPPIEMLACGGAVIASTAGSLVETLDGQAHLLDPDDADGWRSAMMRVVRDDEWWQGLRHGAAAVAHRFTWDRCAAETHEVYRAVCGLAPQPGEPVLQAA